MLVLTRSLNLLSCTIHISCLNIHGSGIFTDVYDDPQPRSQTSNVYTVLLCKVVQQWEDGLCMHPSETGALRCEKPEADAGSGWQVKHDQEAND